MLELRRVARVLAASILLGTSAANAQSWRSIGPGGGLLNTPVVTAPSDPRVGYLLGNSLFRTDDGGVSWHAVVNGPPPVGGVLAVDPRAVDVVFALGALEGHQRLLRSADGGVHWERRGRGLPDDENGHVQVTGLAIGPGPRQVFAATPRGLYASRDGGESFRLRAFADATVAIDSGPGGRLWVAVQRYSEDDSQTFNRVWSSGDGGRTFQDRAFPVARELGSPTRFRFDAAEPERPFLVSGWLDGFAMHLGAAGWRDVSPPGGVADLVALGHGELLAATAGGRLRSVDAGGTWERQGRPRLRWLARVGEREILAVGEGGAWRSIDGGLRFRASSDGLSSQSVDFLAVAADGTLWSDAAGPGLMRSRDGGATWTRPHSGLRLDPGGIAPYAMSIAPAPSDARTVYAVLANNVVDVRLVVSEDGGDHWGDRATPPLAGGESGNMILAVDPRDAARLFWISLPASGPTQSLLFRSADGGRHWEGPTRLHEKAFVLGFAIDPESRDTLLALETDGLLRSDDGGRSFRSVGLGLPTDFTNGPQLALDPEHPQHVFVGTVDAVHASTDGGLTFAALGPKLPPTGERSLVVAPGGRLLVVSYDGVVEWNPTTHTFEPLGIGLPAGLLFPRIAVDPVGGTAVYTLVFGRGVWRFDPAVP